MTSHPILENVVGQAKQSLQGRVRDLRMVVREGQVVLQGNATCYYGKQLAQEFVLSLGITGLVNEIEVQSGAPPAYNPRTQFEADR